MIKYKMMVLLACTVALALVLCGPAIAETKVLSDLPTYSAETLSPSDPRPPLFTGPDAFATVNLSFDAERPALETNPLSGVPEYVWWYGCSPTSGGMMVGYWDGRAGYGNLYDGDASVWGGGGGSGTRSMVASTAHITAGSENGYTYGDWHNSASYPNHQANPNCMADFMQTVDGGSYSSNITSGLEAYVEWDNPNTAINESYEATATNIDVPFYGGSLSYNAFKSEIDAERPVLLDVICARQTSDWIGHSIVGYGYQDNMFQVKAPGGVGDITVGGMAVMDTWSNGTAQSEWLDWSYGLVYPQIDGNGVEWWPFIEFAGDSWIYSSGAPGPYDWMVSDAVTLDVLVPEPTSLALFGTAGLALFVLFLRRRRK